MAVVLRMPEVLAGTTEAAIQTWLVKAGDTVSTGQTLAEVETDKATVELAAEHAGTIGRLLVDEGANVAVGEPILVTLADGDGPGAIDDALGGAAAPAESAAPAEAPAVPPLAPAPVPTTEEASNSPAAAVQPESASAPAAATAAAATPASAHLRIFASPLVRRLAAEAGVELTDVPGTGPNGRVVRRDLERFLADDSSAAETPSEAPAPAPTPAADITSGGDYEDVPVSRMRRTIARRLTESKSTVPHFYLSADCRVDELLELRARVNASQPRKVSVNDFVVKAVAAALVEVPAANAIWQGDSIRRYFSVDLSVAVATEGGLMTPVLRGVEGMPLTSVSANVADLAERARDGKLRQHEIEGGSFSVSNLGMYGTKEFSAILNPPQAGILAVGAARRAPIVVDDELSIGSVMTVTLSADHRVLDGAVAAEWLSAFQRRIENPLSILV